jgi:uncharacterized protein YjbI with pentapeptide repeats
VALTLAVVGAAAAGYLIYAVLRDMAEPKETSLDVLRASIGVAAFFGAVLAGVYAYRKQRLAEGDARRSDAEQLAARYTTAAEQLGNEKAAVRLAGVYAMARLADDWPDELQTCIDVLCAYLRMPYDPDEESPKHKEGEREVRHTIIRVIKDHLQDPKAPTSWCGRDLDFTSAVFDGGTFEDAKFSGGRVSFGGAKFSGGQVSFFGAEFSGGQVSFFGAEFSVSRVTFEEAEFSGGEVAFTRAKFSPSEVTFTRAKFSRGRVSFDDAEFSGGRVSFGGAEFSGGRVSFAGAEFSGGRVSFGVAEFSGGEVTFTLAKFSGGYLSSLVSFGSAQFSGGRVSFAGAEFSVSRVTFDDAEFSGSEVTFTGAKFSRGEVTFRRVADWSRPPRFDFVEPPLGVLLPTTTADLAASDQPAAPSAATDESET